MASSRASCSVAYSPRLQASGTVSATPARAPVASAKVTDYLDLPALASQIKDADYNKKRVPGVVIRMQYPKIAALVFGSGKVVLTGAKSIESLSEGLEIL